MNSRSDFCGERYYAQKPEWNAEKEVGRGREFVEQDKGPAVRHGIFGGFSNVLAAFAGRKRS
jgi:hypothetical protein